MPGPSSTNYSVWSQLYCSFFIVFGVIQNAIPLDVPNPPPTPPSFVPVSPVRKDPYESCGATPPASDTGFISTLRKLDYLFCVATTFGLGRIAFLALLLLALLYCLLMAAARFVHTIVEGGVDALNAAAIRVWHQLRYGRRQRATRKWGTYQKLKVADDLNDDVESLQSLD